MARPKRVRKIGTVRLNAMDRGAAEDALVGIQAAINWGRNVSDPYDPQSVTILAVGMAAKEVNPELDLVLVDPAFLGAVAAIEQAGGVETPAKLPSVVIHSKLPVKRMLVEGWHRAASAERAGVPEIEAVDVASMDLKPFEDWLRAREE